MAQVFYDTGNGYHEADSTTAIVNKSTNFGELRFPLPARRIKSLRLDPLAGEGTLEIKEATIKGSGTV
ncbi:uncharacterized protein METZ01_LOCUS507464, partial [marine metagenome]